MELTPHTIEGVLGVLCTFRDGTPMLLFRDRACGPAIVQTITLVQAHPTGPAVQCKRYFHLKLEKDEVPLYSQRFVEVGFFRCNRARVSPTGIDDNRHIKLDGTDAYRYFYYRVYTFDVNSRLARVRPSIDEPEIYIDIDGNRV